MGVYIYQNNSELEMKNAYIGEYIPMSGLLGYRPLQSDLNDASGNGNNASWYSGTGSFSTQGSYTGARVTKNTTSRYPSTQHIVTPVICNQQTVTIVGWICYNAVTNNSNWTGFWNNQISSTTSGYVLGLRNMSGNQQVWAQVAQGSRGPLDNPPTAGTWYCRGLVITPTGITFYKNGINLTTVSFTNSGTDGSYYRFGLGNYDGGVYGGTDGWVRHCAVYNRELTADEILKYYNLTA